MLAAKYTCSFPLKNGPILVSMGDDPIGKCYLEVT